MDHLIDCVDAGTEYCPCYLAEIGECIMCSQLQGHLFCDCKNWKGVCIYQEYVWNKYQIKEGRKNLICKVVRKKTISDSVMILNIAVNNTLLRELNQPGAYVFLRHPEDPWYYDTPMSVLRVNEEEGTIEIAIQIKGVKTKSVLKVDKEIYLRGPYWNGLLGLKYLKVLRNEKALLIARGIGQASAAPVARKLILSGNEVEVILDSGRVGVNFAEDYLKELGCKITLKSVLDLKKLEIPAETLNYINQVIEDKNIKLVYSGGADKIHEGITRLLNQIDRDIFFTCSNDAKICCGEGICGSCQTRLADGSRVKTCKTQLDPLNIFGGK